MGFRFSYVCDLLSDLEDNRRPIAARAAKAQHPDFRTISKWCLNHSQRIHGQDTDLLALLSCLFPEKRPDRVFWLQHTSLARIIGRCLYLGASRLKDLARWQAKGGGDLGECVEKVMSQAENQIAPGQEVTLEDIDAALEQIASRCRFSSSNIRRKYTTVDVDEVLGGLYRRMSSREAKWLTRMILKSYEPVKLPVEFCLKNIHFLLPQLLLLQDSFEAAVYLLRSSPLKLFPSRPQPDFAKLLKTKALESVVPRLGIKVGRPQYYKARSIKHCCNMVNQRRMSLERKYDGEYCQIHVDIAKGKDCIQIFSKSGKDSTHDRAGIHDIIKRSLAIGETNCRVSRCCILEGEVLVWDDEKKNILEFHKLRKFLTRSGVLIGADLDSQPKPHEHLMIIFFDILLLDDEICLSKPHRTRRALLKRTVKPLPGRADISEQEIIDFSRPDGVRRLQHAFANGIAQRWEGFVIKACDEPYFCFYSGSDASFSRWIKLKKDYIPGLGDTADFALVGAYYDPKEASSLSHIHDLSWTHFFIGCLENKDDVVRLHDKPRFCVVDMIGSHSMSANDLQVLNQWGKFVACNVDSNNAFETSSIQISLPLMDVAFKTPFVVELLGSGFVKPGNAQHYVLRFPRILKVHWDRTYKDAVSFSELQNLAEKACVIPATELQENLLWYEKVDGANTKSEYILDKSQSSSISIVTPTSNSPLSQSSSLISPDLTVSSSKELGLSARACSQPFHTSHTTLTNPDGDLPHLSSLHPYKLLSHTTLSGGILHTSSRQTNKRAIPFTAANLSKRVKTSAFTADTMNPSMSGSILNSYTQHLRQRGSPIPKSWTAASSSPSTIMTQINTPLGQVAPPVRSDLDHFLNNSVLDGGQHEMPSNLQAATSAASLYPAEEIAQQETGVPTLVPTNLMSLAPRPLPAQLTSPLITIPIYCGEFGYVDCLFRQAHREFTFSAKHFLQSLSLPCVRELLHTSNPNAVLNEIAMGIALVNIKDSANALSMQLANLGNEAVEQLSELNTSLPSTAKILFLDRRILSASGSFGIQSHLFLLNEWWAQHGPEYYYATLSWTDGNADNVVTAFTPNDVELLGEFASVEPNIHIFGDRFFNPSDHLPQENVWPHDQTFVQPSESSLAALEISTTFHPDIFF